MMVLGIFSCGVAYAQEPERAPRVTDSEPPYVQDTTLTDADTTIEAQTFRLMARSYGDRIVIRWAPIDAGVWMTSNHYGWHLFRGSTDDNDTIFYTDADGDTVYEHWLTKDHPIMPMTLDEMKQRFDSTDFYAGVAAQAMYGVMHYDVNKADQTNENDLFSVAAKQYQEQTQRQFMAWLPKSSPMWPKHSACAMLTLMSHLESSTNTPSKALFPKKSSTSAHVPSLCPADPSSAKRTK